MRALWFRSRAFRVAVAVALPVSSAFILARAVGAGSHPALLFALPPLVSLVHFSLTPALRLLGIHRYHSTTLKGTLRTERYYELPGGAAFDYLLTVRWRERGPVAARKILLSYLDGLLAIADDVERGRLPEGIEIAGASYFFHAATARRLGFRVEPADWGLRLNLWLHAVDIVALYSFSKGRFAVPNLFRVTRAAIRGDALLARRPQMQALARALRREPPSSPSLRETA